MTDSTVLNATGRARTEVLKVRLSKEEAEIRRRAASLGVSVAEFVRAAALGRRPPARRRGSAAGMDDLMKVARRLGQDLRDAPCEELERIYRQMLDAVLRIQVQAAGLQSRMAREGGASRGRDRQTSREACQAPDDGAGHREADPLRPLAAPRHSRTGLRTGSAAGLRRMPLDA